MSGDSDSKDGARERAEYEASAEASGDRALDPVDRLRELEAQNRRHRGRRYRSILLHWTAGWLRRPRRAEPAPLPPVTPGQVAVSFGGHATVLVRYDGLTIACDPMLGDRVGAVRRAAAPGLTPGDLAEVDLVLITHGHPDHLHLPTLKQVPRRAAVVVPPRLAAQVAGLGFARVIELGVGQSIEIGGESGGELHQIGGGRRRVTVTAAPVRHGDALAARGLSYVIRGDGPSVYFCGDSGYFSGFARIGAVHQPDIAILPIGGYAPQSFRERHMSPLDALYAFEDLQARILIPVHHGAFALSYEQLGEPRRWLEELVAAQRLERFVVLLDPGQSRLFVPPRRDRETGTGAEAAVSSGEVIDDSGAGDAVDDGIEIDTEVERDPEPEVEDSDPEITFGPIDTDGSGTSPGPWPALSGIPDRFGRSDPTSAPKAAPGSGSTSGPVTPAGGGSLDDPFGDEVTGRITGSPGTRNVIAIAAGGD